jgi:hypothetical protein
MQLLHGNHRLLRRHTRHSRAAAAAAAASHSPAELPHTRDLSSAAEEGTPRQLLLLLLFASLAGACAAAARTVVPGCDLALGASPCPWGEGERPCLLAYHVVASLGVLREEQKQAEDANWS